MTSVVPQPPGNRPDPMQIVFLAGTVTGFSLLIAGVVLFVAPEQAAQLLGLTKLAAQPSIGRVVGAGLALAGLLDIMAMQVLKARRRMQGEHAAPPRV